MVENLIDEIFEDIVETIREPLLVLDLSLKIIMANQSFINSFKVTQEETLGSFIYDLGNKQWDIPKLRDLLENILPEKTSFDNYEIEHDFATIGRRIMLLNARQIKRGMGKERIILLAIEDITERKRAEDALAKHLDHLEERVEQRTVELTKSNNSLISEIKERKRAEEKLKESEERSNFLLQATSEGLCFHEQGLVLHSNKRFVEIFGYDSLEEILDLKINVIQFAAPESRELVRKNSTSGYLEQYEAMGLRKDGSTFPGMLHGREIPFEGKTVRITSVRDLTEQKQAEVALRESEEKHRLLFESMAPGVVYQDAVGAIIDANLSAEHLLGLTLDQMLGRTSIDPRWKAIHEDGSDFPGETHPAMVSLEKGVAIKDVTMGIFNPANKEYHWININSIPQFNPDEDKPFRVFTTFDNITERKRMEEQLRRSQKMESIGTLAGGIAHDFNNLLYVVMGNISLAQDDLKLEIGTSKSLKEAEKACIKAKELTARLVTFSKGGDPVRKITSIDDLLKNIVAATLSGSDVKPEISIADAIRQVNIDENQIKQVVSNIVVNAREAMDDNGQLTVSCENVDIAKEGYLTLSQGEYIKISFKDQGCGISNENLEKLFDPYFSTKDMGADKGQGLGLTVSYSIVQKHGGLINVESEPEAGSTFSVYLPALSVKEPDLQKSEKKSAAQKPVKKPATGTGKILLMDDEEAIRTLLRMVINRLGYDVETCIEGRAVIEIYKKAMESKEPFDMVILDLTNKIGMGGQETMRRLLEIDPDVKGIIITG
ncbi:MAG: PAS domain S-box protein, partial [Desulfobacula sp.]|nr:PAS domain S-box protein [Desulfobacula sp.]